MPDQIAGEGLGRPPRRRRPRVVAREGGHSHAPRPCPTPHPPSPHPPHAPTPRVLPHPAPHRQHPPTPCTPAPVTPPPPRVPPCPPHLWRRTHGGRPRAVVRPGSDPQGGCCRGCPPRGTEGGALLVVSRSTRLGFAEVPRSPKWTAKTSTDKKPCVKGRSWDPYTPSPRRKSRDVRKGNPPQPMGRDRGRGD